MYKEKLWVVRIRNYLTMHASSVMTYQSEKFVHNNMGVLFLAQYNHNLSNRYGVRQDYYDIYKEDWNDKDNDCLAVVPPEQLEFYNNGI